MTARDIAERRRAEHALRESEARFREMLSGIDLAAIALSVDGRVTFVNAALLRLTGWTADELVGRDWFASCLPEETRPFMHAMFEQQVAAGDLPRRSTSAVVARTGERRLVAWSNVLLRDARGVVTGSASVGEDITERAQAETDRARLLAAVEQSTDGVLLVDPAATIVYANEAFERLSGYRRQELLGETTAVLDGSGPISVPREAWLRIDEGHPWFGNVEARAKDGHPFETEWAIAPVRDTGGALIGHVAIVRDRSAERALEDQLRQAQKMEAVGQLAGGIAHDFNNLLTAIRGYSELAQRHLAAEDVQDRADLEQVVRAADEGEELTRQLLAFSRRQVLLPRILDPAEVIAGVTPMLGRLLGEHIDFVTHADPGLWRIKVDPGQLEQVIINLAVNARDAMPEGGKLTIETANVELDAGYALVHPGVAPGPYVLLAVTDTGTGMDAQTQAHIFEPFFTTKEPGRGTGMGLATVYGIVKQSGGSIYLYSELGRGTTFKIYFPRTADGEQEADVSQAAPAPIEVAGSETVLLVEDDAAVRAFARRSLEERGYTVIEAGNGDEALMLAAGNAAAIELLVTDVTMPGMQGNHLAARLTHVLPAVRVLYVSGFAEDSVIHQGVARKGTAFLPKPFSAEALARAVRRTLDNRAP